MTAYDPYPLWYAQYSTAGATDVTDTSTSITPTPAKLIVNWEKVKPPKVAKVKDPQAAKMWAVELYTNFVEHGEFETLEEGAARQYPCDLTMPSGAKCPAPSVARVPEGGGQCPHWLCQHHYDLLKAVGESDTGFEALVAEYYGD